MEGCRAGTSAEREQTTEAISTHHRAKWTVPLFPPAHAVETFPAAAAVRQ
jgi:hypothetical protein